MLALQPPLTPAPTPSHVRPVLLLHSTPQKLVRSLTRRDDHYTSGRPPSSPRSAAGAGAGPSSSLVRHHSSSAAVGGGHQRHEGTRRGVRLTHSPVHTTRGRSGGGAGGGGGGAGPRRSAGASGGGSGGMMLNNYVAGAASSSATTPDLPPIDGTATHRASAAHAGVGAGSSWQQAAPAWHRPNSRGSY